VHDQRTVIEKQKRSLSVTVIVGRAVVRTDSNALTKCGSSLTLGVGEGVLDADAVVLLHLVEQLVGLGVQAAGVQREHAVLFRSNEMYGGVEERKRG
jgi:hypothetical protein